MILKKNLLAFNNQGILRCARYAFMPNRLNFCGPDKNTDLFFYCCNQQVDQGLSLMLEQFQTLYPFLRLISKTNQIKDPFDERVVEAYWLGNSLLDNVSKKQVYNHISGNLKAKLSLSDFRQIEKKIRLEPKPHHSFHVFNIWKQTAKLENPTAVLNNMDLCRISWGKIKQISASYLKVDYQPLVLENNKLKLGKNVSKKVVFEIDQGGFIKNHKINDWLSFHWDFACEVLNERQVANLTKYTQESIDLANLS